MYFDDVKECFKTELLCTEMNYFEMRFGHWTVWRIFFSNFCYMSFVFYKHPISVAYGNIVDETYAGVAPYLTFRNLASHIQDGRKITL